MPASEPADTDEIIVSVLIPVYNCGAYLVDSLRSIEQQSLTAIEIIAVDDGSTDGSGAVLDQLAARDPRYRVLHIPNGGIVGALNLALSQARGRYIARMDGDDLSLPDRLERQVAFLDAHPDHVACGCLLRMIDGQGQRIHTQSIGKPPAPTDLARFPPHVMTVPHPTLMARRTAMLQLGGYRAIFPHAEDHDLFLRMAELGGIALMQEHLFDYRVHGNAVSERNRATQLDSVIKAQLAAVYRHRVGRDPFTDGQAPSLDSIIDTPGMPPSAAWDGLRNLRRLEQDINRMDPRAGWRQAGIALLGLIRHRAELARAGVWAGLARRTARGVLRLLRLTIKG